MEAAHMISKITMHTNTTFLKSQMHTNTNMLLIWEGKKIPELHTPKQERYLS